MKKIEKAINIVQEFEQYKNNPDIKSINESIVRSIRLNKPIRFIIFTCSVINSEVLYDNINFDKYIRLSAKGNNLEENIPILKQMFSVLNKNNIRSELIILIGNTDPYYIYSRQINDLEGVSKSEYLKKFNIRWTKYKNLLNSWLKKSIPEINFKLISWFEFETQMSDKYGFNFEYQFNKILIEINRYFALRDFQKEFKKLKNAFGKGKYFEKLDCPSEKILKDWIKRKFCEYAVQGLWIKLFFLDAILIQNEKPALLRYKMYQPLIKKLFNSTLPNIFIYGISERGYQ